MKMLSLVFIALFSIGCTTYGPFLKPRQNAQKAYLEAHPKLSADFKQSILDKKIMLGMSKDDVIAIWGKPDKIFPKGKPRFKYEPPPWNEEWLWKGAFFRSFSQDCTVTFVDDKVSNIQCDSFWGK